MGSLKKVEVRAGEHRYEVLIGPGLLAEVGALVRLTLSGPRCAVITDTNVAPLYGETVCARLREAGFQTELVTLPAGEATKSFAQAGALCQQLNSLDLDRSSFLLALGGGVVGDLIGFVASIFLRGLPYVSLPTTLLAQVDSCIGGKTAVNTAEGKNLIGTIHHPSLVIADSATLRTLPDRLWNEGFAEAIKHGIIRDAELFAMVAQASSLRPHDDASSPRDEPVQPAGWKLALPFLTQFIERSLAIKAEIVATDEREQNDLRSLLNFGHTIGHAIEHAAGYGNILHGEAVSLGLIAATQVSVRRAGLSLGDAAKIRAALAAHHLPTELPADFPRARIFEAVKRDKKFVQGRIRFVVAHEIGRASVADDITMDDLRAAVNDL